jgi:hypothetical protein
MNRGSNIFDMHLAPSGMDTGTPANPEGEETLLNAPEVKLSLQDAMGRFRFQMNQLACYAHSPGAWKAAYFARKNVPDNHVEVMAADNEMTLLAKQRRDMADASFRVWQADSEDPQKRMNAYHQAWLIKESFDETDKIRQYEDFSAQLAQKKIG